MPLERKPWISDLVAGVSVAFIAIPQSLANAEIAGMPAYTGLYATALPVLLAAFFASSRYLQTGPVATTALLTFGALTPIAAPFTGEYIVLAGMLALLVGIFRLIFGLARLGRVSDFMSHAVILGFTAAAAILIIGSQVDKAFGAVDAPAGLLDRLFFVISHPADWSPAAVAVATGTGVAIVVGRRLHALFPGVLVAAIGGILIGVFTDYPGAVVGAMPAGLPTLSLAVDWTAMPSLLIPALVIAVVGFAEPTAIARTFAAQDRERWDPNRELIGQGVANIAASLSGAFPVGGSFARSSLARVAGARTRWTGAVTGLTVIAFLPFASVLSSLPQAVLGAIVIVAVSKLIRWREMIRLVSISRWQALVAWGTALATLALSPRIDLGILVGVGLALAVHVGREVLRVNVTASLSEDTITLMPSGVLFFASASRFQQRLLDALAEHREAAFLRLDLKELGRIDYSGAVTLAEVSAEARAAGVEVELVNIPPHAERIISQVRERGLGTGD